MKISERQSLAIGIAEVSATGTALSTAAIEAVTLGRYGYAAGLAVAACFGGVVTNRHYNRHIQTFVMKPLDSVRPMRFMAQPELDL